MSSPETTQRDSITDDGKEISSSKLHQVGNEPLVTYSGRNEDSDEEYHSADGGDGSDREDDLAHNEADAKLDFQSCEPQHSKDIFPSPLSDSSQACDEAFTAEMEDKNNSSDEETNVAPEENDADEDELEREKRKKIEDSLTEEEIQERKRDAQNLKDDGNSKFRKGDYKEAETDYTEALSLCPLMCQKERAIMYSNRAACKLKQEMNESAIKDCTKAVELHPQYLKALLRRAELYEKTEKLDEALADYQKVLEMDPGNGLARAACVNLPQQINERNEKMKEEMMGKLKELGNLVLRPFGLSTNNFKMQQDPQTGSYSMQFQQNPPGNGT